MPGRARRGGWGIERVGIARCADGATAGRRSTADPTVPGIGRVRLLAFGPTGPVAHFIAQNAQHHTDTDPPVRHTSLNPRAPAVQKDVLDGFP